MTYRTGVYTPPTDNNPFQHAAPFFFRDVMRPALLDAGYTVASEFITPNSAYRNVIFNTPAGAPATQLLIAVSNLEANGSQTVMTMSYLAKPYDTTTRIYRGLAGADYTTYSYDAAGYNTSAEMSADNSISATYMSYTSNFSTNGFEYWLSATTDHVVLATRVGSGDSGMIVAAVDAPTPQSKAADGTRWARTSVNYDQIWGMPSEPGIITAGSASYFGMAQTAHSAVKDAFSQTRVLAPTQLRHRLGSDLRGYLKDLPIAVGTFANGDTLTDTNGKVRVLLRTHPSSANFYAVDTTV